MKKYIVFGYDDYYPSGGMNDIIGQEDSLEKAIKIGQSKNYENIQIVDRDTWEIIGDKLR
jgi:hypothetical protein